MARWKYDFSARSPVLSLDELNHDPGPISDDYSPYSELVPYHQLSKVLSLVFCLNLGLSNSPLVHSVVHRFDEFLCRLSDIIIGL